MLIISCTPPWSVTLMLVLQAVCSAAAAAAAAAADTSGWYGTICLAMQQFV